MQVSARKRGAEDRPGGPQALALISAWSAWSLAACAEAPAWKRPAVKLVVDRPGATDRPGLFPER